MKILFPADQKIYDRLLSRAATRDLTGEERRQLKNLQELRMKNLKNLVGYNYEWDTEKIKNNGITQSDF